MLCSSASWKQTQSTKSASLPIPTCDVETFLTFVSGDCLENYFCRYCNSGKKRCPVSGGPLKVSKGGKVLHTVDFALRKLIITQAGHAKVPSRAEHTPRGIQSAPLIPLRSSNRTQAVLPNKVYAGFEGLLRAGCQG